MMFRRVLPILAVTVAMTVQLTGCGCDSDSVGIQNVSAEELASDADVVFVGQAVHEQYSLLSSGTSYVVEVGTLHKGVLPTEVLVDVGRAGCGFGSLELDVNTVMFGTLDEEGTVQLSFSTTDSAFEQDVIEFLGEGERPAEEVELSRSDGLSIAGLFGRTALLYAVLGLGCLAVFSLVGKWVSGEGR